MKKGVILGLGGLILVGFLLVSACAGPQGPEGPPGPSGAVASSDTKVTTNHGELTLGQIAEIQPGLGTVMMEYGKRFAMAKLAADAGDWGMAGYQLDEQLEIQEVGEATRPANAAMLKSFEDSYLVPLDEAIKVGDKTAFDVAYTKAIDGCNACHTATGHPFIRFQSPQTSPEPFLKLAPSEAEAHD